MNGGLISRVGSRNGASIREVVSIALENESDGLLTR
jgi:hypothetical protein